MKKFLKVFLTLAAQSSVTPLQSFCSEDRPVPLQELSHSLTNLNSLAYCSPSTSLSLQETPMNRSVLNTTSIYSNFWILATPWPLHLQPSSQRATASLAARTVSFVMTETHITLLYLGSLGLAQGMWSKWLSRAIPDRQKGGTCTAPSVWPSNTLWCCFHPL